MTRELGALQTSSVLHQNVARFYERFPYPSYPLYLPLRWQEGYLASSGFAGRLRQSLTNEPSAVHQRKNHQLSGFHTVLLAGSGETLPYIIRRQEPNRHRLLCVDLSAASLRRAAKRNRLLLKRSQFIRSDISKYLQHHGKITGPYDHVDIYGVLHHTANPSDIIKSLSERLHPQGSIRLMVYNSHARRWIVHLQKAFRVMGLDAYNPSHLLFARKVLKECKAVSKPLRERLSRIANSTFNHPCRFADTFFHAREATIPLEGWLQAFSQAGLCVYALFDRYGELDDLENPLWKCPTPQQLATRIADGRFENNFELFLCRSGTISSSPQTKLGSMPEFTPVWRLALQLFAKPPRSWFSFEETKDIAWSIRLKLWQQHLRFVHGHESQIDGLLTALPTNTLKRLARLGAIMPGQFSSRENVERLKAPLVPFMEPLEQSAAEALTGTSLSRVVIDQMQELGNYSDRRFFAVMRRIEAAQG